MRADYRNTSLSARFADGDGWEPWEFIMGTSEAEI
jgi:hypothetical protein